MYNRTAIIAGAIGGIVPNLLRLSISLTTDATVELPHDVIGYALGMLLLALIGAGVIWAWGEKNPRRALYLGIGLPALLQVASLQSRDVKNGIVSERTGKRYSLSFSLITSAYAGELTNLGGEIESVRGRKIAVRSEKLDSSVVIAFYDGDENKLGTKNLANQRLQILSVPGDAVYYRVQYLNSQSSMRRLLRREFSVQSISLSISLEKGNGFLQALGIGSPDRYEIAISDLGIKSNDDQGSLGAVEQYFEFVNARNESAAYALLSERRQKEIGNSLYHKTFVDTSKVQVLSCDLVLGDSQESYVNVTVKVWDLDRHIERWSGIIVLRKEKNSWRIDKNQMVRE